MINVNQETIYFISTLGNDKVSIIDGDNFSIIREVEIGQRPQDIVVDEKNNVYVATDRNSRVTVIDDLYNIDKSWHMPNNGNIKLDSISQKIYVCDTEEICIYSIENGKKLGSITGFIAADSLVLDKEGKRLFVLDIFQNEIKVYSTESFHLSRVYKDVGNKPNSIFMGDSEEYIYISNNGINRSNNKGNVSMLDIESGNISYIDFPKGSIVTDLEADGNILYAANTGLHRIEVIDIISRKCIGNIKTTLPELQRLRLSPDKKTLLVTSRDNEGKGVIDKIDIFNNSILDTFTFKDEYSFPFDIAIINKKKAKEEKKETLIFNTSNDNFMYEKGTKILSKKVLSTYEEKIIFPQVVVELALEDDDGLKVDEIIFENCRIMEEGKNIKNIYNEEKYSFIKYDFYIPYYIEFTNEKKQKYLIEGRLKGKQKAIVYISNYKEEVDLEYVIKSSTKLINQPVIKGKFIRFDASAIISTHVIKEEVVFIPFCKHCMNFKDGGINE